ncbi:MAG: HNH endonuclease [Deltaproteobacteria bacterium]|nr:HNH endonuclease [Deltaproteobacteria bacterium]
MQPTARDFQNQLIAILNAARQSGKPYIDVESRYLHTRVGEHPNLNQEMPVCCDVMRKMMRAGDFIVNEPPSGEGATLMIRYQV